MIEAYVQVCMIRRCSASDALLLPSGPATPTTFYPARPHACTCTRTGRQSDAAIATVLQSTQLSGLVQELGGLDGEVEAGGSNLSMGQRQLLCTAR